jgi:hypothetical protein
VWRTRLHAERRVHCGSPLAFCRIFGPMAPPSQPAANQQPTSSQPAANQQPTSSQPTANQHPRQQPSQQSAASSMRYSSSGSGSVTAAAAEQQRERGSINRPPVPARCRTDALLAYSRVRAAVRVFVLLCARVPAAVLLCCAVVLLCCAAVLHVVPYP